MNFLTFLFDLNLIVSRSSSSFVAKLQMTQHVHDGTFLTSDVNYNDTYSSKWEDLFLDKTIDEIIVIFYRIYNEGVNKFILPYKIFNCKNKSVWQSVKLKRLIIKKERLWRSIRCSGKSC